MSNRLHRAAIRNLGGLAFVLFPLLLMRAPAEGQVVHFLDCVSVNEQAGTVTAFFGYFNPSPLPIPATAGTAENLFLPEPMTRTQPSSFLPGEFHFAFGVTFPIDEVASWLLFGIPLDVSATSPSCQPLLCEACAACPATASLPVLDPVGLIGAVVILGAVGIVALRRVRSLQSETGARLEPAAQGPQWKRT